MRHNIFDVLPTNPRKPLHPAEGLSFQIDYPRIMPESFENTGEFHRDTYDGPALSCDFLHL